MDQHLLEPAASGSDALIISERTPNKPLVSLSNINGHVLEIAQRQSQGLAEALDDDLRVHAVLHQRLDLSAGRVRLIRRMLHVAPGS